ncbi:helix-turn-helix transcriptional regulator [Histidinibacterium lentulum]|uniref:YafY family transcriptional regulator n=1 Tax=Histidinibacterium lentulum TaxID=2480588 RepID=A0A3N2R1B2_9RHOB|nr:YafY family protein [Histidinibacterium lentulum]ROU01262.1 YafY family transcriptional regulator [Histidinibacterium lentulum]
MARSDRLFRLLDALRRLPPPVTAERLATEAEVSVRTIYRDIETLRAAGARIEGAAGWGYGLTEDPALPPQQFTRLEVEAVAMGLMEVRQSGDATLAAAAETAMARITAALPERRQREALHAAVHLHRAAAREAPQATIDMLREACWDEIAVDLVYRDADGEETRRRVLPLCLVYLDRVLILLAWCGLREDYRQFRLDRIAGATPAAESFRPRRVPLLRAYIAGMEERAGPER